MKRLRCCNCSDTKHIHTDFIHHIKQNGDIICEKCCYHLYLKNYVSPNYIVYDDFLDSVNGCFDIEIRDNLNDNNEKIFFKIQTNYNANTKFIVSKNYENYENLLFCLKNNNNNKYTDDIYNEEIKKFSDVFQIFNANCHWLSYNIHRNLKDMNKLSFEY